MNNPQKEMTCTEAVRRAVQRWPIGEKKFGPVICDEVRNILYLHNSRLEPMDGTILRRMREIADAYGIEHVRGNESKYVKTDRARSFSEAPNNYNADTEGAQ